MNLLVFLQNAYGVEDGYIPDYSRDSFRACYTGKRLKKMIPDGATVTIRNCTPEIGKTADSNLPPDIDYMLNEIDKISPDVVLACGKNARVLEGKHSPVIFAPHPAWRQLSEDTITKIRNSLQDI